MVKKISLFAVRVKERKKHKVVRKEPTFGLAISRGIVVAVQIARGLGSVGRQLVLQQARRHVPLFQRRQQRLVGSARRGGRKRGRKREREKERKKGGL
jgi:hypothetical protein